MGVTEPHAVPHGGETSLHFANEPVAVDTRTGAEFVAVEGGVPRDRLGIAAGEDIPDEIACRGVGVGTGQTGADPRSAVIRFQPLSNADLATDLGIIAPGAHRAGDRRYHVDLQPIAGVADDRQSPDPCSDDLHHRHVSDLMRPSPSFGIANQVMESVLQRLALREGSEDPEAEANQRARAIRILHQVELARQHRGIRPVARIGHDGAGISWGKQGLRQIERQALGAVTQQGVAGGADESGHNAGWKGDTQPQTGGVVAIGTPDDVIFGLQCNDQCRIALWLGGRRGFGRLGHGRRPDDQEGSA